VPQFFPRRGEAESPAAASVAEAVEETGKETNEPAPEKFGCREQYRVAPFNKH